MLKAMTDIIEHRGPNDFGFFAEEHIGLGFRRLSIIDLAEGGIGSFGAAAAHGATGVPGTRHNRKTT